MTEPISKKEFLSLSRPQQSQYAERMVFNLVETNPEQGVTLQEVRKQTPLSISTISKYLDVLLAKRRIYKVSRGSVAFYFPNGIPLHKITEKEVSAGKKSYRISLIQNHVGKILYIQELETDGIGLKQIVGGINIPVSVGLEVSNLIKDMALDKTTLEH